METSSNFVREIKKIDSELRCKMMEPDVKTKSLKLKPIFVCYIMFF